MRTFACAVALSCLLPSFTAAAAEGDSAAAAKADPSVARVLDGLGYTYEIDEEGDYKLVFAMGEDEGGRSQLVYVRSPTESYGTHRIREIWSPAYLSAAADFDAVVANRLLAATQESKMGAWAKQNRYAVFVVKVPAEATAEQLDDAIDAAVKSADEMEAHLTPGKDDF